MAIEIDPTKFEQICKGVVKRNDKTYYVQCSISGEWFYCNDVRFEKLIEKYGSAKNVGTKYISRDAKQSLREKKPERKVSKQNKTSHQEEQMDFEEGEDKSSKHYLPRPKICAVGSTDKHIGQLLSDKWTKCIRPDVFVQIGGFCNNCKWYEACEYVDKEWKSFEEQESRKDIIEKLQYTIPIPTQTENLDHVKILRKP